MGIFIGVMNPIWSSMLEESDYDFYHLPEYVSIESKMLQGEAIAYFHQEGKNKMLIPLIRRKIPPLNNKPRELYDAGSPYGYPGILFNRSFDYNVMDDFLGQFIEDAGELQLVSTVIRLNPYYNNVMFMETEHVRQVTHGHTVWINLQHDMKELFTSFSKNHRANIKSLQNDKFKVIKGNWKYYQEFVDMYYSTMDRNQANNYYYFDEHYFMMLKATLQEHLQLFVVKDANGNICSGGIFTHYNGIIQSHLVATRQEYLQLAPVKLVFYEAIKWGKQTRCRWMNLGGGRGSPTDSLLLFKQGFSKLKRRYSTLQIVHDQVKYQNILQQLNNEPRQADFFPVYRASPLKAISS
ncbi:GNAT family N-acetyltransferase [Chitinophaga pendula]|uniref:GNAT family N-acetyltransferase n=1 Tax=Chitinophaga TaxID=79328 RepID=UPI0012FDAFDC|nr:MULTISPECIES: GNAT family N-acetyltransferase [Chitinophaga]UCJ06323.1 GNAT family N-acetyltransferase [Chitinophaga pendula]